MIARRRFAVGGAALALGTAASAGRAGAQAPGRVLRAVPQAEPQVFDPHQSQANVTSVHAAMMCDTLFSWDADMVPRPRMVDTWTKSDDRLLYTFTLPPGYDPADAPACCAAPWSPLTAIRWGPWCACKTRT